jgi:hypothetical protein
VSVPYGRDHEAIRSALLAAASPTDPCWRCGQPLGRDRSKIDLGHRDDGPGWAGLEHAKCNRQAGARKGNTLRQERRTRTIKRVDLTAVAIEVSEDRQHTAVVTAGTLPQEQVLLTLAAYLDGTDPVADVLQLGKVVAVVVDPHSHASTAIRPLEAAGVTVTRPTSGDVAEAHGLFIDTANAGRIRHQGQAELTAAMRHLEQRKLGGASGPERRGALVDVAPIVAGELAVWALLTGPKPYDPTLSVW